MVPDDAFEVVKGQGVLLVLGDFQVREGEEDFPGVLWGVMSLEMRGPVYADSEVVRGGLDGGGGRPLVAGGVAGGAG